MRLCSFIVDDIARARRFVEGLPRKLIRKRFPAFDQWEPRHVVLAEIGGKDVALADCIVSSDGGGANAGLIAAPSHGAYSLMALLKMKQIVKVREWQSTVVNPTPAILEISRRFFDSTFDQFAWDLSNILIEQHGPQMLFHPDPLVISRSALKSYGLPPLEALDQSSKRQILTVAKDLSLGHLVSPNGSTILPFHLMAMAFDLLKVSAFERQGLTRTRLLLTAAAYGHQAPDEFIEKYARPDSIRRLYDALAREVGSSSLAEGIFQIEPLQEDPTEVFVKHIRDGTLPNDPRWKDHFLK